MRRLMYRKIRTECRPVESDGFCGVQISGEIVPFCKIKRKCHLCGLKLSGFNETRYCFCHQSDGRKLDEKEEADRLDELKPKRRKYQQEYREREK